MSVNVEELTKIKKEPRRGDARVWAGRSVNAN